MRFLHPHEQGEASHVLIKLEKLGFAFGILQTILPEYVPVRSLNFLNGCLAVAARARWIFENLP